MTDLHTHILPGIDDGAKTAEESLALLRMEKAQGVDTVVLTPHFYSEQESVDSFLMRREEAMKRLQSAIDNSAMEQTSLPRLMLGAEVLWRSDLVEWERLDELCISGTRNLLLELPFVTWTGQMIDRLYDMIGCTGITPIIAHLERYLSIQPKSIVQEILELGVPVQISAEILVHPLLRRGAMKLLKKRQVHLLASDCHDCTQRVPNLAVGMDVVRKKMGERTARELCDNADRLVTR